jgi:RNA-binding protein
MVPLTPSRRSELRAQAHKLAPVVIIGDKGLSDEVVAEIDRALKAHELIKVKAASDDRKAREAWLGEICERLQAHPVQSIGKVLVVYREDEEKKDKEARRKAGEGKSGRASAPREATKKTRRRPRRA